MVNDQGELIKSLTMQLKTAQRLEEKWYNDAVTLNDHIREQEQLVHLYQAQSDLMYDMIMQMFAENEDLKRAYTNHLQQIMGIDFDDIRTQNSDETEIIDLTSDTEDEERQDTNIIDLTET